MYEAALIDRGKALLDGLTFVFGDYLGNDAISLNVLDAQAADVGDKPPLIPTMGILLTHRGTLAAPMSDAFTLGWFLGEDLRKHLAGVAGDALGDKLNAFANELADILATDKYVFESSAGQSSDDLWNDYLAGELPTAMVWLGYQIEGLLDEPVSFWLGWPQVVLERMFGPAPAPAAPPPEPKPTPTAAKPEPSPVARPVLADAPLGALSASPAGIRRILRVKVPLLVTLAETNVPTGKLLEMGPGSIVEFERPYNFPLMLSVGNLPIALGEAVKIGDHFGLKITTIVSPEERVRRLGGKSPFPV